MVVLVVMGARASGIRRVGKGVGGFHVYKGRGAKGWGD